MALSDYPSSRMSRDIARSPRLTVCAACDANQTGGDLSIAPCLSVSALNFDRYDLTFAAVLGSQLAAAFGGAAQLGAAQVGVAQLGAAQVGAAQVGAAGQHT